MKKKGLYLFLGIALLIEAGVFVLCYFFGNNSESVVGYHSLTPVLYLLLDGVVTVVFARIFFCVSNKTIRNLMITIYFLEMFWLIVKVISFHIPYPDYYLVWYLYYLPMLGIPLCLFVMNNYISIKNKRVRVGLAIGFSSLTLLLLVAIFTSDFHSLIYVREASSTDYSYGPLYYVIYALIAFEVVYSLIYFFIVTRKKSNAVQKVVLIILFALGIAYSLVYILVDRLPPYLNMTLVYIVLSTAGFAVCTHYGLFIDSGHYDYFFQNIDIPISITSKSGKSFENAAYRGGVVSDRKYLEKKMVIKDSNITILEDITSLEKSRIELENQIASLKATNALLAQENVIKKEQESAQARKKLYKEFELAIKKDDELLKKKVAALPDELSPASSKEDFEALQDVKNLISYIKKKTFLFLLSHDKDSLSKEEIQIFFSEAFNDLKPNLVDAEIIINKMDEMPLDTFSVFYFAFADIASHLKGQGYSLLITFFKDENEHIKMRLSLIDYLPDFDIDCLNDKDVVVESHRDEDETILSVWRKQK